MRRIAGLAAASLAALAWSSSAGASGDYGCYPSWKLVNPAFNRCGNSAVLAPGNDTRVNLFHLLRDQRGQPSAGKAQPAGSGPAPGPTFFSWRDLREAFHPAAADGGDMGDFHGSRCMSVALGGRDFAAALAANGGVPAPERALLSEARGLLVQRCNGAENLPAMPEAVTSGPGREFLRYLKAADAFYAGRWDASRDGFAALRAARDPWVAETGAYMLARVELNAAQDRSFDEYGYFNGGKGADAAGLARSRTAFDAYLARYGEGRYAVSARGLARRLLWLGGDVAALSREYESLLGAVTPDAPAAFDLVQEIDSKLLAAETTPVADGPLLLATIDLMRMRPHGEEEVGAVPLIGAAELAAQEPRFAGHADLFSFVTASHAFYVQKDYRRVLALIPDDARRTAYAPLAFSRQVLRGLALAALADRNEAGFWRELLGGADPLHQRPVVELALAMNLERGGRLADVFAPASPIGEAAIREILLQYAAGPDLLRAEARNAARPRHERDLALFTLLYKQLGHGDYAGFLADLPLVPREAPAGGGLWDLREAETVPLGLFRAGATARDAYACPALADGVAALARAPRDVRARLCLGEFYRLNGFDDFGQYEARPRADELGGTPGLFPGSRLTRGAIYADVIAHPQAAPADRAYALYRAIHCYAPGGNNGCGGRDVAIGQRRAWFQRLKREFPASEWAKQLRYYW